MATCGADDRLDLLRGPVDGLDQDLAPVGRIGGAAYEPSPFEAVDQPGRGARGEPGSGGQLARGQRAGQGDLTERIPLRRVQTGRLGRRETVQPDRVEVGAEDDVQLRVSSGCHAHPTFLVSARVQILS